MAYSAAAWERAMRIQEVLLRAISGEWHWFKAGRRVGDVPAQSAAVAGAL